ncbi:MAG TPA: helical backbone metal receptor [Thermoanaerobaculia bacterium]|nr:helical backbone metal receptor [Thermoanaerobaculia bacterium]
MFRDVRGRAFALEYPPKRVVSLVPSLTETLFDLGAGDAVVGITDFCIFPAQLDRPRVGGTKTPHVEAIRALRPDFVHVNLEENLGRHAAEIETFAPVFVTEPKSVDDVRTLIATLGEIHDRRERAAGLIARIDAELSAMPKRSFTFACAIWKKPWMWCGGDTYVSNLIECAGGQNVFAAEKRYPQHGIGEVEADVIFLPDEPYAFTPEDAKGLRGHVVGPFPGHLFTWHGSRTILGLRFLRELVLE